MSSLFCRFQTIARVDEFHELCSFSSWRSVGTMQGQHQPRIKSVEQHAVAAVGFVE